MAGKRVMKCMTDWVELGNRVPKYQQADFLSFRVKSNDYLRKVMANPEEPPKIDWSYYKANAANKALVEQFEKQYAALKIPYPDDKGAYQKVEEEKKQLAEDIAIFMKNSNARIKQYEEDLAKFDKVLPIEELSLEELEVYYPQVPNNSLEHPMTYPETSDSQESEEEVQFWQRRGVYYNEGDRYHPKAE